MVNRHNGRIYLEIIDCMGMISLFDFFADPL